jgi:hypothetical protein
MKSGYQLRNITVRNTSPTGQSVPAGPNVSSTYPLGYFREDYEYSGGASPEILDVHNGRFCVTPEYPNGTYAYFATVDANWNSAYPYVVGPTFYGTRTASKVTSITEPVTLYNPASSVGEAFFNQDAIAVFPNPTAEFVAVQFPGLVRSAVQVELVDLEGRVAVQSMIQPGSTVSWLDIRTLYAGTYLVRMTSGRQVVTKPIVVSR